MTKLDPQTIKWLKSSIANDEYSSDEELVEHFMTEGPLEMEEAEKWVKMRDYYLSGLSMKQVAVIERKQACPHCENDTMVVILHWKNWWLECADCGDVVEEKERHEYAMAVVWP